MLHDNHVDDVERFEKALVGSVIEEPVSLDRIADLFEASFFLDDGRRKVFESAKMLRDSGVTRRDTVKLGKLLRDQGLLPSGSTLQEFLRDFTDGINPESAIDYARRLLDLRMHRQLVTCMGKLAEELKTPSPDRERLASSISVMEQQAAAFEDSKSLSMGDLFSSLGQHLVELRNGATKPLLTGFSEYDKRYGGLTAGLYSIGGYTGIGKSIIAADVSLTIASNGGRCLYLNMEMSRNEVTSRIVQRYLGISSRRVLQGNINDHERLQIQKLQLDLRASGFLLRDDPHVTIPKIRAWCRIEKATLGLDMLVIDYLGLLGHSGQGSFYEQVSKTSRQLKLLSKELRLPILSLCQLNRKDLKGSSRDEEDSGQDRFSRPGLHNLRDSGSIEQDSDEVWFIHRESRIANDAELLVSKCRNHFASKIDLEFDPSRVTFIDRNGGTT